MPVDTRVKSTKRNVSKGKSIAKAVSQKIPSRAECEKAIRRGNIVELIKKSRAPATTSANGTAASENVDDEPQQTEGTGEGTELVGTGVPLDSDDEPWHTDSEDENQVDYAEFEKTRRKMVEKLNDPNDTTVFDLSDACFNTPPRKVQNKRKTTTGKKYFFLFFIIFFL